MTAAVREQGPDMICPTYPALFFVKENLARLVRKLKKVLHILQDLFLYGKLPF